MKTLMMCDKFKWKCLFCSPLYCIKTPLFVFMPLWIFHYRIFTGLLFKGAVMIYGRGWGWREMFLNIKTETQLFLHPALTQHIFLICKFCRPIKGECKPSIYYWFSSTNHYFSNIESHETTNSLCFVWILKSDQYWFIESHFIMGATLYRLLFNRSEYIKILTHLHSSLCLDVEKLSISSL